MKTSANIIKKIQIQVSGKTIDLTVEEAEELREALNKLMGVPAKEFVPMPYPVYPRTWIWDKPYWTTCNGGTVTYKSGTAMLLVNGDKGESQYG